MKTFSYEVLVEGNDGIHIISGEVSTETTRLIVEPSLPEGKILSAKVFAPWGVKEDEKIFINGYQTWTYCPEYSINSKIRGLHRVPKFLIDAFALDRYADYHFVNYPYQDGILHGESYAYFRDGDFYRLVASNCEHFGYTLISYESFYNWGIGFSEDGLDNNRFGRLVLEKDCAGLVIKEGTYKLFDMYVGEGSEDEVYDGWFAQMNCKAITSEKIKGYSSWYNRYENITEDSVMEDLEGCSMVLDAHDLFQVDDGWETNVGDWLKVDPKKFPNGMKAVADKIRKKGFKAGLWLAPFSANESSEIYKNHPDWFLKVDEKPWKAGCNWGGFYSLDIDNPCVVSYIREVFNTVFNVWGFDLVKLDFLYSAAPYGTPISGNKINSKEIYPICETRAARMCRAMDLLREVCGKHPILGCGVPVWPAFGKVEYCRVSCDVSLNWKGPLYMRPAHREIVSTKHAIETTKVRQALNGRAHLNDPDVFFLRDGNIHLSKEQKRTLATSCANVHGVFLTSDNMGKYSPEKKSFYKSLVDIFNN